MIRELSIENFMSIRKKQVLSFEATKDKTSHELLTVEIRPGMRLNRMLILYGANASGKSNILYAYETIWRMLVSPYTNKLQAIPFYPFALDKDKNTRLSVSFYIGQVRYDYSVEYNNRYIISEKMEYAPNGVLSLFYSRKFVHEDVVPDIEFGRTVGLHLKSKKTIVDNTLNNHTVLSTFAKVSLNEDAKIFRDTYNWIVRYVHGMKGNTLLDIAQQLIDNKEKKDYFISAMRKADFNISNISIDNEARMQSGKDVFFTHHTIGGSDFTLSSIDQSLGTLRYFQLQECMFNMLREDHIYSFDEIESNLHYDLLLHFLTTFMMNTANSQILFTTQDQQLLDEEFIRRDMVWFTEKSKEDASTELYCASEFGLHKNLSLYKAYRTGKLGAKPELGSIF